MSLTNLIRFVLLALVENFIVNYMNNNNKEKTLKELKEDYETQIIKENEIIKECWDKLNESILDDSNSKGLTIANIRVIVSQMTYASKNVGSLEVRLLENK